MGSILWTFFSTFVLLFSDKVMRKLKGRSMVTAKWMKEICCEDTAFSLKNTNAINGRQVLGNLSIPCIGYIQKFRYLCCYILCIPLGTNNSKELIKNIEDKKEML